MGLLKARWLKLSQVRSQDRLVQELLCVGCAKHCRKEMSLREAMPTNCASPKQLEKFQKIKDSVDVIFNLKGY